MGASSTPGTWRAGGTKSFTTTLRDPAANLTSVRPFVRQTFTRHMLTGRRTTLGPWHRNFSTGTAVTGGRLDFHSLVVQLEYWNGRPRRPAGFSFSGSAFSTGTGAPFAFSHNSGKVIAFNTSPVVLGDDNFDRVSHTYICICLCICTCVRICIRPDVFAFVLAIVYVYVLVYVYMCMYLQIYAHAYGCACGSNIFCMYMCMCMCMRMCMCMCMYMVYSV